VILKNVILSSLKQKMGIDKEGRMKKEVQIGKDEGGMGKLK
jgi:hypothetical protein